MVLPFRALFDPPPQDINLLRATKGAHGMAFALQGPRRLPGNQFRLIRLSRHNRSLARFPVPKASSRNKNETPFFWRTPP